MSILIKGGRVLNPANETDKVMDVLIVEGKVKKVGEKLKDKADTVINAKGKYVMPGLIDLHVHLRDPGFTDKETVETGAKAAAAGGYTTIVAMPNTKPVVDNSDVLSYVLNKGKNVTKIHVYQAGAITKGMDGKEINDLEDMAAHGAIAFSEDGKSVMSSKLCRDAMHRLAKLGVPFLDHCEDIELVAGGVVNQDENAERLGLPGIHNTAENVISARDYLLATEAGAKLHLCHVSTAEVVNMLKGAKAAGDNITAEVCPHHFCLTSDDIPEGPEMTNFKMNPPLRKKVDVDAIKDGLKNGYIDCISTDHAPHTHEDKNKSMLKAPFGIVGLETAAALTYTELVETGILTPLQMAEKMSYNPSKIIGVEGGEIAVGKVADIVIFNPETEYVIDKTTFLTKSKNTPFDGKKVKGKVELTICDGEIVYSVD